MADIDHEFTDEIVCPHCGHVHMDSWEREPTRDQGSTTCSECEKPFKWERHCSVTYSTEPPSTGDSK